ncbi:MAG: aminopeptidase N, partial [Planctomycetota bacterium]
MKQSPSALATRPTAVLLKDYQPPAWKIESVELRFELGEEATTVHSRLEVRRNPRSSDTSAPLVLDGEELELVSVVLDGRTLGKDEFVLGEASLTLPDPPDAFLLEITVRNRPAENTRLMGLYLSSGLFCTQCEAEGFRRITYFPDRPDVLSRYTTTIVADRKSCPVLLSNGNRNGEGKLQDGRHWARWVDPFPKPSYLFALVAGDLRYREADFTTCSGKKVKAQVYVEPRNHLRSAHALECMLQAMRWDEERFGREFDLDAYMIVAVDDFNFGAMENKGLNIFNSKYVLADPETATDSDFLGIQGVIGHEYFHNWTGDRVTLRNWFQLSLKEGLTIFRDQEFSSDLNSRAVKRIQSVENLRATQFPQDAGPMAHSVRPDSYIEIGNFYTATVYNKGAEVVRMVETVLGRDGFRKGMDLYFERHDGQAVTIEDFLKAMEDANGTDLGQILRWYTQAGTPVVHARGEFDPDGQAFTLHLEQSCPPTPEQPVKEPFLIPVAVGLLDRNGKEFPLRLEGEKDASGTTRVLRLDQKRKTFRFLGVSSNPVVSLLRGFSAPIRLDFPQDPKALALLLAHDSDSFNRWEAAQRLATGALLERMEAMEEGVLLPSEKILIEGFRKALGSPGTDPALLALALSLPSETFLAEQVEVVHAWTIHQARESLNGALARELAGEWESTFKSLGEEDSYRLDPVSVGRRSLRNLCLSFLCRLDHPQWSAVCRERFRNAGNMTDVLAALQILVDHGGPAREEALAAFQEQWKDQPLVMDKWFRIQALSFHPDTLERVQALLRHPAFTIKNPNRVRALLASFSL